MGTFVWAPIPVSRYEIRAGYGHLEYTLPGIKLVFQEVSEKLRIRLHILSIFKVLSFNQHYDQKRSYQFEDVLKYEIIFDFFPTVKIVEFKLIISVLSMAC